MFKFAPYLTKTLWRHRARTMMTVAGAAIALFVFCFVGAVQEGLSGLESQQQGKQSMIAFQANKFCPATSHLPQDYQQKIERIEGVRDVVPIQVFTNNCRASLDVVVFYGLPAEKLQRIRDFTLVQGDWQQFTGHQDAALVGRNVADRRGIQVGERFSLGGFTVTVAGVFSAEDPAEENYIYTHLDFLQRGKGWNRVGTVTQFEVLLSPGADATQTCEAIDGLFRAGPTETDTRPKGVFQAESLGDLAQLIGMSHFLGYACVGLVLMLVATTTLMSVQDRVKEHAVLQTLGFSSLRVFVLVLTESAILSLLGGLLGVGAAMLLLSLSGLSLGAEAVTIAFTPSLRLAGLGMAVAIATGLLAGLAPAWHAARVQIVPALRQA
jgi:putative ABC transport system permease protein